jgi:HemY protein
MKLLFYGVLALVAAVVVAVLALPDPGYVLIGYGDWSVETTLVMLAAGLLLLYGAVRLLVYLRRAPGGLLGWERQRRARRCREALNRGLIELAEGRWADAERQLKRHARNSDSPLVAYLAAARAAQLGGASDRRDQYLRLAHEQTPEAELAVGLSQAELQMAAGQLEQALATLRHLHALAPRHTHVLKLLGELYQRLGEWNELKGLIPELRRRHIIDDAETGKLLCEVHAQLLKQAAGRQDIEGLEAAWAEVPKRCNQNEALLLIYVEQLRALGASELAEPQIRHALKRAWNPRLVYLYGQLEGGDPGQRLSQAEEWYSGREQDPVLLLTLGRLCLQNELWGKARTYLEGSAKLAPTAETYRVLGGLLDRLGEPGNALACYRKGMELALGAPVLGKRGGDVLARGGVEAPVVEPVVSES